MTDTVARMARRALERRIGVAQFTALPAYDRALLLYGEIRRGAGLTISPRIEALLSSLPDPTFSTACDIVTKRLGAQELSLMSSQERARLIYAEMRRLDEEALAQQSPNEVAR